MKKEDVILIGWATEPDTPVSIEGAPGISAETLLRTFEFSALNTYPASLAVPISSSCTVKFLSSRNPALKPTVNRVFKDGSTNVSPGIRSKRLGADENAVCVSAGWIFDAPLDDNSTSPMPLLLAINAESGLYVPRR